MRLAQSHQHVAQAGQPADGTFSAAGDVPPGLDGVRAGSYFPDSRVASNGEWISPVSYREGSQGPAPVPNDVLLIPRGGESPWIIPVPSEEQGFGRSPGHKWPWQIIGESYNFDSLAIMPFENEQTSGFDAPGWHGRTPPERPPVFAYQTGGRPYYEQTEGYVTSDIDQVAVTDDPQQAAYTIGWGSLDTSPVGSGYGSGEVW